MTFPCKNVSIIFRKFHLCVTEANHLKSLKNAQFTCDVVLFFTLKLQFICGIFC